MRVSTSEAAEVGDFTFMVVDDEGLRPDEISIGVRRRVGERDGHGELSAFVAEVADDTTGERKIGCVVEGGSQLLIEDLQDVIADIIEVVPCLLYTSPSPRD